jgi:hypothetical protein
MSGAEPPCRWQDVYFFKTLEEITILPSAWRLRTQHESQKTPKEDMLPVPILFWRCSFH